MVAGAGQANQVAPVLRGTLITMRRRCGKPGCRCAQGQLHEGPALSVSLSGRSVTVSLHPADVPAVAAALARYHAQRAALEDQATAGVQALRARGGRRRKAGQT